MITNIYRNLWVGNRHEAREHKFEFNLVVTIAEDLDISDDVPPEDVPQDWSYWKFETQDGTKCNMDIFWEAVELVSHTMKFCHKVLIHCYEGVSRSTSVILGVMMKDGLTFDQAWYIMKSKYPKAGPNKVFVEALRGELDDVENQVNKCYLEVLKRNADYDGLCHYKQQLIDQKIDIKRLKVILKHSEEYRRNLG